MSPDTDLAEYTAETYLENPQYMGRMIAAAIKNSLPEDGTQTNITININIGVAHGGGAAVSFSPTENNLTVKKTLI